MDDAPLPSSNPPRPRRGLDLALLVAGLVMVVACALLAVTGASRAVAAVLLPLGVAVAGIGAAGVSGRHVSRWVYVVLLLVVVVLATLGVATLGYALTRENIAT